MTLAVTEIAGGYTMYDESQGVKAPVLLHDAARPFVVILRYHAGYKHGMRNSIVGRAPS